MNFNSKKEFQSHALELLKANNYNGTICASTGSSKSKVAIDAIKEGKFKNILITSPRSNLKENWKQELKKWGINIFPVVDFKREDRISQSTFTDNIHPYNCKYFILENIQTCYKWSKEVVKQFDLIIYDEIHTCGEEFFNLIRNAHNFTFTDVSTLPLITSVIGLTATPNKSDDFKKEVLYKSVPILVEYYNAEEDGLTNSCKYYVLEYQLTDQFKVVTGSKDKKWLVGEKKQYDYLSDQYEKAKTLMFLQGAENYFEQSLIWMKSKTATKEQKIAGSKFYFAVNNRKKFLWNLESSKQIALALKKRILEIKTNKILLFSELTTQAEKLSLYSIHSNNSKNAKECSAINTQLLEQFNSGSIRELSSVRSLQLGLNMSNATHAIFESYSGSEVSAKQSKGRLNRLDIDEVATIIIIKPLGTQASTWFEDAFGWIEEYTVINKINELPL